MYSLAELASSLLEVGRDAEALPLLDECLAVAETKKVDPYVLSVVYDTRLHHYMKTKDVAAYRRTLEQWEKRKQTAYPQMDACFRAMKAALLRGRENRLRPPVRRTRTVIAQWRFSKKPSPPASATCRKCKGTPI